MWGGWGLGGRMSSNLVEPPHYDFPSYGPVSVTMSIVTSTPGIVS